MLRVCQSLKGVTLAWSCSQSVKVCEKYFYGTGDVKQMDHNHLQTNNWELGFKKEIGRELGFQKKGDKKI